MKTLLTALALVALLPLAGVAPQFWQVAFCLPSAWISAIFLNAPVVATGQGYMVMVAPFPVHVTLSCSAAGFFILTATLAAIVFADRRKGIRAGSFAAALGYAYAVTIAANSARIVLAWYAERWARLAVSEAFWSSIHLCVGLGVFLTFLVAAYGALTWRPRHGQAA